MRSAMILAICMAAATAVHATTIPETSVGFVTFAPSMADGSTSGNINSATSFTLGDWSSTFASGVLTGMPSQSFGSVSFNTTIPTSLTFGNAVFGTFTSNSITVEPSFQGFLNLVVLGLWTPGTQGGLTVGPFEAQLDISFVQTPINSGFIFATGIFATSGSVIPEPPSIVLGLTGLAAGVVVYQLRRRRRASVAMI